MKSRLIVNADDYGLNDSCSDAILQLASVGHLSSTTILANMCPVHYLEEIKSTNISTGIHLNLIEGKPLSPPESVLSLVDPAGNFKPSAKLFLEFISGKINPDHIETELTAQYKFLIANGIKISHADSHQHVHIYPLLGKCIRNILKKLGCQKIRNCKVSEYADFRMALVRLFQTLQAETRDGFSKPDFLIPAFSIQKDASQNIFSLSLKKLQSSWRTAEYMTHPATHNDPESYLNKKAEFDFLKNPSWKKYLLQNNIELISYDQL